MRALIGLIILFFVCLIFYFLVRAVFLWYSRYNHLEKILAVIFFSAEAFIMVHALGYFSSLLRILIKKPDVEKDNAVKGELPPVAILIPVRHEPAQVLENLLISCHNLNYPRKTIYVLDDSTEEKYQDEAEALAYKYHARIFRRRGVRHGAKAGIINECLQDIQEEYVAIFDADQNPVSDFLSRLIPVMQADPGLALVQTPQFYTNNAGRKVSYSANTQQGIFYEYVCEAKSGAQAMICCGTNVIIRVSALRSVSGFDESNITEDFSTSLKMHLKGWRTRYDNRVCVFGLGPENLLSYFKQQNRWAMGNVGVLRTVIHEFFKNPRRLSLVQWFEYMITGSYYLIGWAYLFLFLCPILYVFFNIPSFFMDPVVYAFAFSPYIGLSLCIFYITMHNRNYSFIQLVRAQALIFITFPVYARASLYGLLGRQNKFQVTSKADVKVIAYSGLWMQIILWTVSLAAFTWGINRIIYEHSPALVFNVFWIGYHLALFSAIFYFNEE